MPYTTNTHAHTTHTHTHTQLLPRGYIPGSTNDASRNVEHTNRYNTAINTVPRIGTSARKPSSMYLSNIFLILHNVNKRYIILHT